MPSAPDLSAIFASVKTWHAWCVDTLLHPYAAAHPGGDGDSEMLRADGVDSQTWLASDDLVVCNDGAELKFVHDNDVDHGHRAR